MKKILILTLGTGSIINNNYRKEMNEISDKEEKIKRRIELREKIYNEKIYNYFNTKYQLSGKEIIESEFVAEPLIKEVKPDYVFIIGSVRSAWTNFYTKFAVNTDFNRFCELDDFENDIDAKYGINTDKDELQEIQKKIKEIYDESGVCKNFNSDIKIYPLLIRYGINDSQLVENYNIISSIEDILEKNEKYEISFDITHSFRSMPLYNLVILNYIKNVTAYDITLKHVFYGNFDIKRENKDIAPILDFNNLVEVLNLTNGVSEFKNSGSVSTILHYIPDNHNELKNLLNDFKWSIESNDVSNIIYLLGKIIEKDINDNKNEFTDIEKMLRISLSDEFLHGNIENYNELVNFKKNPDNLAEFQYLLATWCYKQGRYGQALATALETLRSYMMFFYGKMSNKNTYSDYIDEANRKEAVRRLGVVAQNKNRSEYIELFSKLEENRQKAVNVRNIFAHALMSDRTYDNKDIENIHKNKTEIKTEIINSENKKIMDDFMCSLDEFRDMFKEKSDEMYKAYASSYNNELKKKDIIKDKVRCYISDNNEFYNISQYKKSATNVYKVYILPTEIKDILKKDRVASSSNYEKTGQIIYSYINYHFDIDNVEIILSHKLKEAQKVHYAMFLQNKGCNNIDIEEWNDKEQAYKHSNWTKVKYEFQILEYDMTSNEMEEIINYSVIESNNDNSNNKGHKSNLSINVESENKESLSDSEIIENDIEKIMFIAPIKQKTMDNIIDNYFKNTEEYFIVENEIKKELEVLISYYNGVNKSKANTLIEQIKNAIISKDINKNDCILLFEELTKVKKGDLFSWLDSQGYRYKIIMKEESGQWKVK